MTTSSVPASPRTASPWLRRLGIAVAVLAGLVIVAWLAVPPIARSQLESRLTEALGRPTTVEGVSFDPFRLVLTLRKFVVGDRAGGAPLLAVDEAAADLSVESLWQWAPVLDGLRLVHPVVALGRDRAGRYTIQDLIDRALAGPSGPTPKFSVNNIEVVNGEASFDDGVTGRKHALKGLELGLPFLSSLPYDAKIRVLPKLAGEVDGSRFAVTGSAVPFVQPREAAIDVNLTDLALPQFVGYLPQRPRVELASGRLTTALKIVFVEARDGPSRLELRGDLRVDDLALKRRDGTTLAAAKRIAATLDPLDPIGGSLRIAQARIDAPTLDVIRGADGTLEWAKPLFDAAADAKAPAAAPTVPVAANDARPGAKPAAGSGTGASSPKEFRVAIATLGVTGGTVALVDEGTGFKSTLVDVVADVTGLGSRREDKAHVKASFVSADRIAAFEGEADLEPLLPAANGRFALTKFSLGLLFPYYKDALAVDVQKGSIDYASTFALAANGDLHFSDGTATLADLRLAFPGAREPLWRVPQLAARGIDVDVAKHKVTLAELTGRGAAGRLARERDGSLEMARLVKTTAKTGAPADAKPGAAAGVASPVASAPASPANAAPPAAADGTWTLLVQKGVLDRVAIDLEDRVVDPPQKVALRDLAVTATGFTNARGGKGTMTLASRVGEKGRIAYKGPFTTNPFSVDGAVEVANLNLLPAKPYVEPDINVVLVEGRVSAKGTLALTVPDAAPVTARWKGDVTVLDFATLDKPTASDLARWKTLALEGLSVDSGDGPIAVQRIGLEDFHARAIVYPDGSLNLLRLATPGEAPEPPGGTGGGAAAAPGGPPPVARNTAATTPKAGSASTATPPAAVAPTGPSRAVTIGQIDFARGEINFSDFFVRPNYSTTLTDFSGSISTMSADKTGDVAIVAKVNHLAPVEIQGRLNPFAPELLLDIAAKARDIDLPPLAPYAVKYAGYGIEKGKLTFDVRYRVENRKLSAENRLVLDQLTFGPRVESPTATKLPVLLAVALLKDTKGVIDIRLPISGSLDDPKFSVGGLIIQVIVNLITKAATAPFALLAAAFGGGDELSTIGFAAGSSVIAAEQQARIDTLGKALSDRPALKVDLAGRADPATDTDALRHTVVETQLRQAKMKALAGRSEAPASLDAVKIEADERARWLTAVYKDAPLPDRPRNAIGMLKDVPPAEMEAALFAAAKVDDDALRALATARAQAVKDALVAKGVAAERLFPLAPRLGEAGGGTARGPVAPGAGASPAAVGPATRVDLALR